MTCSAARIVTAALLAAALSGAALFEIASGRAAEAPMPQHRPPAPAATGAPSGVPVLPGQDAFGAIQEIVLILEADPKTDWSKVNLEALRQHLIDMNEVTLKADAAVTPTDGGVQIAVTGTGRTLAAIERMVPAHAHEIDGHSGRRASTRTLPNGVLLTVTAADPREVQHLRSLGFSGILVSGMHHQPHHLAIARGEAVHTH